MGILKCNCQPILGLLHVMMCHNCCSVASYVTKVKNGICSNSLSLTIILVIPYPCPSSPCHLPTFYTLPHAVAPSPSLLFTARLFTVKLANCSKVCYTARWVNCLGVK